MVSWYMLVTGFLLGGSTFFKDVRMKLALISDIHANLEALQAVLADISARHLDRIVFLGDAVGYGANPNECVTMLCNAAEIFIAGNHDRAAAGIESESAFNDFARTSIQWTKQNLTKHVRAFLQTLALQSGDRDCLFVHATPECPEAWEYIMNADDASVNFPCFRQPLCFVGHSHYPMIFIQQPNGAIVQRRDTTIKLQAGCRYIINCGSVGQPRDGSPLASYGIYDSDAQTYHLVRVAYNVAVAQQKICNAGLPAFLARRLSVGR